MATAEIHDEMKKIEMLHREYRPDAKYLKVPTELACADLNVRFLLVQYRRLLVDWMCEVGDELTLHNSTMHVAVSFSVIYGFSTW